MKIGNSAENGGVGVSHAEAGAQGRAASGQPAAASASAAAKQPEASATINLSSAASSLLAGVSGDEGSFDAEKVQRVAQAIAEGKFSVNAEAIADKLIANAREVLGRASNTH